MPKGTMIIKHSIIALDQLVNAITGGWADETLSARAWRLRGRNNWWNFLRQAIDILFFFQPNHCSEAYHSEVERRQLPPEMRGG